MHQEERTLFINYEFNFSVCRLVENLLFPSTFQVKAEVDIVDETKVELALRKINYWLYEYVTQSIVIPANSLGLSLVLNDDNTPRLQNQLMITPDEPTDDHFCLLLQSKLQALAAGAFAVGTIELTSDNADGLTFTYTGDSEDELPTMDEWISGPTWFDQPWWLRDDSSTFDTVAPAEADLSIPPAWATDLNFLNKNISPQEAIVLKADFSPRIIDDNEPE